MSLLTRKSPRPKPESGRRKERIVPIIEPKSAVAEAYRTVRTNLQFTSPDQAVKSVLVTSAGPGEGKSTTVANLGVTMAAAGSRTLLVDSDLRRPALHKSFNLPGTSGLTTILAGKMAPRDAIASTLLPSLFVLPAGPLPPNPAEVLSSRRMGEFAEFVKNTFDFVLYDSPPIISLSDALILCSSADAVILVVRCGLFPYELIRQAKTQLEGVKANVLGVLLNRVNFKRDRYYYRYYYDYYSGYYYGSKNDAK